MFCYTAPVTFVLLLRKSKRNTRAEKIKGLGLGLAAQPPRPSGEWRARLENQEPGASGEGAARETHTAQEPGRPWEGNSMNCSGEWSPQGPGGQGGGGGYRGKGPQRVGARGNPAS